MAAPSRSERLTLMMTKGRLEAFSDGVIAIAATLLVLNLKVPPAGGRSLGHALAEQWPSYAAYATSFMTIGIIWTNHHSTMERLRLVDQSVLIAIYYAIPSPTPALPPA